jgi:hypothetical protein
MVANKTALVAVRLKLGEKARIVKAASARDLRLSEYIRMAIAAALKSDRDVSLS